MTCRESSDRAKYRRDGAAVSPASNAWTRCGLGSRSSTRTITAFVYNATPTGRRVSVPRHKTLAVDEIRVILIVAGVESNAFIPRCSSAAACREIAPPGEVVPHPLTRLLRLPWTREREALTCSRHCPLQRMELEGWKAQKVLRDQGYALSGVSTEKGWTTRFRVEPTFHPSTFQSHSRSEVRTAPLAYLGRGLE
jgi:hypothetical protein